MGVYLFSIGEVEFFSTSWGCGITGGMRKTILSTVEKKNKLFASVVRGGGK